MEERKVLARIFPGGERRCGYHTSLFFLAVPDISSPPPSPRWPWLMAWALAALLMAVLFGAWPYQHWYFADRVELAGGLVAHSGRE